MMKILFKVVVFFSVSVLTFQQGYSQVYIKSETKRLNNGKVVMTQSEILLEKDNGKMTVHYSIPEEFYVYTNTFGEVTVYFPATNEVMKQQNAFYSTKSEMIYHFFAQQAYDLGLSKSGFRVVDTRYDEQYLVTTWESSRVDVSDFKKAELVMEDYLPIYLSFQGEEKEIKQKSYFANWEKIDAILYPTTITQIDFIPGGDSIVSRKRYSEVVTGEEAERMFNKVEVPDDAKLISFEN